MYVADRLVDARCAEVLPQTAMQVVGRHVDASCAEVPPPNDNAFRAAAT